MFVVEIILSQMNIIFFRLKIKLKVVYTYAKYISCVTIKYKTLACDGA